MLAWLAIVAGLLWVGFAYAGYPLLLGALRRFLPRPPLALPAAGYAPPLTVVIAVHNGARELAGKLENTLAQEYPGRREVIVSSDGSTDATESIAASFEARGVRLVRGVERRGKEAAQAAAIAQANGDVLVFSDVSARLEPGALLAIVQPFADATIGSVSSEDVVDDEAGEGAYVRFEMALRRLESEAATLVGLSGSFFAVRRALCTPWPSDLASDFRSALESARRGLRAISEPRARARFGVNPDVGAEWNRKVRTVRRGLAVLFAYRDLLHPRHGRAALALWGHKVARFTSPLALVLVLVGSLAAAPTSRLAALLAIGQILGYAAAVLSLLVPAVARWRLPRLAGFFLLVNASMLVAWWHHLRGERAVLWQPTQR
ncbi:MAG TPA: glycosyltransferase [Myxococcota bacterium]|jgi:hypothetical protein|nr:glycosyltransferase [Myxococcota bacterium]